MKRSNYLSRIKVPRWTAAWLTIAAATASAAPIGTAFTYQGRLNANGARVSNLCDFRFSLWNDSLGAEPAHKAGPTLTFDSAGSSAVTVTDGLFMVQLDFGPEAFNGQALWLQIAVRCPPEPSFTTLTPRQQLTAAPFALFALRTAGGPRLNEVSGTWLLRGGDILPVFDAFLDVTALVLNEDRTGRIFFKDRYTDAQDCARILYLYDGESLLIDFIAEPYFHITTHPERTTRLPVVVAEGDFLGLADDQGNVAQFSRQTQLPPEVTCGQLEVVDVFTGLPIPQFFTGLSEHLGDLIYSAADQIELFDLDTETIGAPLGPTENRFQPRGPRPGF